MNPHIYILILNWNGKNVLKPCLDTVLAIDYSNYTTLVIDNDSSPSHIATAFGIPTIGLFSQAIREIFRPYNPINDHHFVFYKDVDCRECGLNYCPDRICLDFSQDEVFSQALAMLSLKN